MATYIILSRFSPDAFRDGRELRKMADVVARRIKKECKVNWKLSWATLGRYDVVDVVEASDPKEVEKATIIIRSIGHCTTETLQGTPWNEFLRNL